MTPWRALISVRFARSGAHKIQLRRSWISTVNSTDYTGHSPFERISISEFRLRICLIVCRILASPGEPGSFLGALRFGQELWVRGAAQTLEVSGGRYSRQNFRAGERHTSNPPDNLRHPSEVFDPSESLRAGGRKHLDAGQLHIVVGLRNVLVRLRLSLGDCRAGDFDLMTDVRRQVRG